MRVLVALLALLANVPAVHAQTFRGTIRDRETDQPVWIAAVTLVDFFYKVRAVGMTDDDGRYDLVAPGPGRYKVRADARGYAPTYSGEYIVQDGDTVEVDILVRREDRGPVEDATQRQSLTPGCVPQRADGDPAPPAACEQLWTIWVTNCYQDPVTVFDTRHGGMRLVGTIADSELAVFLVERGARPDIVVRPHEDVPAINFQEGSRGLIAVRLYCARQ